MKKILLIFASIFALTLFTSCEDADTSLGYNYYLEWKLSSRSNVEEIENSYNKHKIALGQNLDEAGAYAEWNKFLSDIDDSKVVIVKGDYYTVKLAELVEMNGQLIPGKIIGMKTWGPNVE